MLALPTQRQRDFVRAYVQGGTTNATQAAREADYRGDDTVLHVSAYRLMHDDRVQMAIQEECRRMLTTLVPMAMTTVKRLADPDAGHDPALKFRAAQDILNRTLPTITEHRTIHEHLHTDADALNEIRMLAEANGIPLEALVGGRLAKQIRKGPVIEAQYEELDNAEDVGDGSVGLEDILGGSSDECDH
jgi:hypothetical protein